MNHARTVSPVDGGALCVSEHGSDSCAPSAATRSTNGAALTTAQQHFPLLGGLTPPRFVPADTLDGVDSALAAVHLSLQIGNRQTQGRIADRLGIGRAHFSRMLNGSAALALDRVAFACVTGNWALLQWEARQAGCDLMPHNETEIERLRRENAALREAKR